jgi:hypothetical protein
MDTNIRLPEIEIEGDLFCPHCGNRLFSWGDATVSKCPHLIFVYGWNAPDMFLAVRADFARSFMLALLKSQAYRECLREDEMEPITKQDQEAFCQADFGPGDSVACLIAAYCNSLPEKMFPTLLSRSTTIFKDDRLYSGVHIAVDLGISEHEVFKPTDRGEG